MAQSKKITRTKSISPEGGYTGLLTSVSDLLEQARRQSARAVNALLTATYWEIGRRIVEFEQSGERRAEYGNTLIAQLSHDLTQQFGRGFGPVNLSQMRKFYQFWPQQKILQTLSEKSPDTQISQTPSAESEIFQTPSGISEKSVALSRKFSFADLVLAFPLPWSHYVRLLSVANTDARAFYEAEAIRGGWPVRQLDCQISTQFYERTALSKNRTAMLQKGAHSLAGEIPTAEEEIKDPYVQELGGDFAFIGRQRRLRIGGEWYRVDLLFFHRKLRCLVVIDLKVGKFTHADAGQMHLYLNYAREHWMHAAENPPVGLILCAEKDSAVAKYALEGLSNKVLAAEYKLALPDEKRLVREMQQTRKALTARAKQ